MRKRWAVLNETYASIALFTLEDERLAAVCCTVVKAKMEGLSYNQKGGVQNDLTISLSF